MVHVLYCLCTMVLKKVVPLVRDQTKQKYSSVCLQLPCLVIAVTWTITFFLWCGLPMDFKFSLPANNYNDEMKSLLEHCAFNCKHLLCY